jgi:thiol-disulfide isomerase/thioredoxin
MTRVLLNHSPDQAPDGELGVSALASGGRLQRLRRGSLLVVRLTSQHVKKSPRNFGHWFVRIGIFVVLAAGDLLAQAETNSVAPMDKDFVKTNGQYVTIGNAMFKTNSPLNTDEFKKFMLRRQQLLEVASSGSSNATDQLVEGAWALIEDYPNRTDGYELIMMSIEHYEYEGKSAKARAMADELLAGSAPERFKLWAKGVLNRLDSYNKSVSMQFTAVDGRDVDLATMKGKVVLVDFWATWCGPCVAELPRVKAAYDKYHAQGFEVIGISCDTDREQLKRFIKEKGLWWPQYFDGKQQESNKFAQGFGIDGIPHMFLVDRRVLLRFDNVRANDKYHPKGDTTSFEEKISKLLVED